METSTAVFSLVATAHPRYLYVSVTRALTHGARTYYPALRSLLEINLTTWPKQLKRPECMQDHKQHICKDDNILMNKTEHKFMNPRIPANQSHNEDLDHVGSSQDLNTMKHYVFRCITLFHASLELCKL